MAHSTLMAVSPLDGRYFEKIAPLSPLFSEYGLMHHRLIVEIQWLVHLSEITPIQEVPPLSADARAFLNGLIDAFDETQAQAVKTIEQTTNHDVKAIEYYLKQACADHAELQPYLEFIHFACTSEDINNLAYAMMLKKGRDQIILPALTQIASAFQQLAHTHADQAMLARTHGQTASPTTLGKEMANFHYRLQRRLKLLEAMPILGKCNGAVGNFNAHHIAYPEVDWPAVSKAFVESLDLQHNPYTTQIESHDYIAELFATLAQANTILIDACRDIWTYISLGYFKQQMRAGEVGSSTMPHKVNPIDFENAEGNLGLANAIMHYLGRQLPTSRLQRDLVDSTLMRNVGVGFAHSLVAYQSLLKGIAKLQVNPVRLNTDLAQSWEVLAEAIQTVMRRYGLPEPYEQLKHLTRGADMDEAAVRAFISQLALPDSAKASLLALTPQMYTGLAETLAKNS